MRLGGGFSRLPRVHAGDVADRSPCAPASDTALSSDVSAESFASHSGPSAHLRPIDGAYSDGDPKGQRIRCILFGSHVVAGIVYLCWRLTVFNPHALLMSTVFYGVELVGFFGSLLLFFVTFKRRVRTPRPPCEGLAVDVFITTRNEDMDLVRRTVVAAMAIRYPHETWLLDDGNRPAFQALADELGCRYLARHENRGAKAGNLNNALMHSRGDFVALLDADHCADPILLDRLLGYFDDPLVSLVQTPQDYYNLNSFQHGRGRHSKLIWHEQSGFHHVEQPGRDYHDAATLCGCSCVLRRAHLDQIGGFPEQTVTEDMHVAVKLQKLGLKTVYHDEPLAFGIAPPDLFGFLVQRLRWGEGNMQVCRIERLPFARRLTWRQNLSYLLLGFAYIDAWRKLILYFAPIGTLITGVSPVFGRPPEFALFITPYLCSGALAYWEFYGGFGRLLRTEAYAMARLAASLLATWGLFRRNIRFRVSQKRLMGRTSVMLALPQFVILLAGLYAIGHAAADLSMAGNFAELPWDVATALMLLVAYHCWLAAFVLLEAGRAAKTNEPSYRFDLCFPIRLNIHRSSSIAWTSLIWLHGARMRIPAGFSLPARCVTVELFLPGKTVKTVASAERVAPDFIELQFHWTNLAQRDQLDQMLHAGRWHRVVTGRHEVSLSPLERIGLLSPSAERTREAHVEWEPMLVRSRDVARDLQLAYLRATRTRQAEIILFERMDGPIEVAHSRIVPLAGRRFLAGGPALTPLIDEIALECCGGVRRQMHVLQSEVQRVDRMPA